VWRPSIWEVPLETGLDEGSGEGPVVPIHDQVDGGEGTEGLALIAQDFMGKDSNPERIEGSGREKVVTGIRSQIVVVEGEFVGIPEEIEDTSAKFRGSVTVAGSLGGRSGLLQVLSEDLVRFI